MPTDPRRPKSLRATVAALEAKNRELERQRNGLLDIVNAAIVDAGGSLVLREMSWRAARRHDLEHYYVPGAVVIRPKLGQSVETAQTIRLERPEMALERP